MAAPTIQRQINADAVRTLSGIARRNLLTLARTADNVGDREAHHRALLATTILDDGDPQPQRPGPDHAEILRALLFSLNNLGGFADGEALNAVHRAADRARAELAR